MNRHYKTTVWRLRWELICTWNETLLSCYTWSCFHPMCLALKHLQYSLIVALLSFLLHHDRSYTRGNGDIFPSMKHLTKCCTSALGQISTCWSCPLLLHGMWMLSGTHQSLPPSWCYTPGIFTTKQLFTLSVHIVRLYSAATWCVRSINHFP